MKRRALLAGLLSGGLAGCFDGGSSTPEGPIATERSLTVARTARETAATLDGSLTPEVTATPAIVESLPTPTLGEPEAPVEVMAFEDFACPHCRNFALNVLPRIVADFVHEGTVRFEHHDYPLPVSKWSWPVANAARAIQHATDDVTFFAYATVLYKHQSDYTYDLLGALAEEVGVDGGRVERAARAGRYRPVLEADRERAIELNAGGTPEVYVRGRRLADWRYETIRSAIVDALERTSTP